MATEHRPSQAVILIHGISSTGEWQETVRDVLEPHFHCVVFKYSEFFRFGAIKATLAFRLRARVVRRFQKVFEESYNPGEPRPHVIAHSFGTVLTADLLDQATVKLGKLILTGSALAREFRWSDLFTNDPDKVGDVRNEIGDSDWVVFLARISGMVSRKLGDSGRRGFKGPHVHDIPGPWGECSHCSEARARVHNVSLGDYAHSGVFLTRRHASELWLPYLWGVSPQSYRDFIECCREAGDRLAEGRLAEADALAEKLGNWTAPRQLTGLDSAKSLIEYARLQLNAYRRRGEISKSEAELEQLLPLAIEGARGAVVDALKERDERGRQGDTARLLALNPVTAVVRAIGALVDAFGNRM